MGSNNDLRIISIAVAFSLLVGIGAGYMVGNSPLTSLMEEKDGLEAEYESLDLAFQNLEVELDSVQELLVEEQRDNALLQERYMEMLTIDRENQLLHQQVSELELDITSLQNSRDQYEVMYEYYQREYYQRGDFGVDFEPIGTWENENITLMNEELWYLHNGIRIMVNYLEGEPCPTINVPGSPTWNIYTGSKDWNMVLIDIPTDNIPKPGRGYLIVEVSPTPWFSVTIYKIK